MSEERKEMQSEHMNCDQKQTAQTTDSAETKQTTQINGAVETNQCDSTGMKKRRSAISIMGSLIGLVKPLIHIMLAAIVLGTLGYLCAIFLTILAGQVIVHGLLTGVAGMNVPVDNMWLVFTPVKTILIVMVVIAVLRGLLHYVEQYCNHFIAFKLLAIIRHKVFAALRKLCPAKLEGRDKGNLISIITTDIELLEVFYAHTISPIAIATLTSAIMVIFIGRYHVLAGLLALAAYLMVGVVIPLHAPNAAILYYEEILFLANNHVNGTYLMHRHPL